MLTLSDEEDIFLNIITLTPKNDTTTIIARAGVIVALVTIAEIMKLNAVSPL